MSVLRHGLRFVAGVAIVLALAWGAGLVWFTAGLDDGVPAPDTATDAIVVLTGGKGRITAGLDLLAAGKGRKLFVSGVNPGVTAESIAGPSAGRWAECCIVLGHAADNTIGNAVETARWLAEQHYHSLRLVTANYHMRRALLEFGRVLPSDVTVVPDPVDPGGMPSGLRRVASPVVMIEYTKYLIALVRPLVATDREAGA
ncbi:MAG TPA: YdcF family protein [Stellaceae bacterium]|nr:YdcF family protein [Stellaceae bacterium]